MKLDYKWRVFGIVAVGIFIATLDGSIVNIANPSIAEDFGISIDQVEWVVTTYLLAITATLIFLGRLGDKIGSHKIYTYGFLIFSLGSLACSLAGTLALLIFARLLQGLGASMMMATGIGIVSNTFPPEERGKALGLTGTAVAMGNMVGPGLGGLLLSHFSWPAIFLVNVPIGLAGYYLGRRYLPAQEVNAAIRNYDFRGTLLLAACLTLLILSLADGPGINWPLLLMALAFLGLFYRWERKATCPVIDFELFKIPVFVQANLVAIFVYFTQTSVFFLLPFYMEIIQGYTPYQSGLLMTITPLVMALVAPTAGYLSDKVGSRRIIAASLLILSLAYLVLSGLNAHDPRLLIWTGLICLGIGMGSFGSPNTSSLLGSIPAHKAGYGGGFIATTRNLSYSLGVTCSVALFSWIMGHRDIYLPYQVAYIEANRTVYLSAAGLTMAALVWWIIVQFISRKETPS